MTIYLVYYLKDGQLVVEKATDGYTVALNYLKEQNKNSKIKCERKIKVLLLELE